MKHYFAKAWFIGELLRESRRIIVITHDQQSREELTNDLDTMIGETKPFPSWELLPYEAVSPSPDITASRISCLNSLSGDFLIVTQASELLRKTISLELINKTAINLKIGEKVSSDSLETLGYTHTSLVSEIGQYGTRGDVIDIFPVGYRNPIRLEGREKLVSIREFDPESQRSINTLESIEILRIRETILPDSSLIPALAKASEAPPSEEKDLLNKIDSGKFFEGCEWLSPKHLTILEILPKDTKILLLEKDKIYDALEEEENLILERFNRMREEHRIVLEPSKLFLKALQVKNLLKESQSFDSLYTKNAPKVLPQAELRIKTISKIGSGDVFSPLKKNIKEWREDPKHRIAFIVGTKERAERFKRILLNHVEIDSPILETTLAKWFNETKDPVVILIGSLKSGFILKDQGLSVISEEELFGERSFRQKKARKVSLKKLLASLGNLSEGDFAVHTDSGIAIYEGIVHRSGDDYEGDFLVLQFADSKLFVPVYNVSKVQKFVAADGQTPKLDKLSNPYKWIKTKKRVREAVAELAGDLIKLYAARSLAKGWRYDHIGALDDQFAESFPFDETLDQAKAIEETLNDLASDKPMDRLVCGDVGFGKTEVAIRAAYKVTQHRRQIAVLVPTTILVEQHKRSFERRFEGYDIVIEGVSRFSSPKKNKEVLSRLREGEVDIVIGTHRLLSKDVSFKDLGLVIIDEEHRFGVKQKEKFKALKKSVDVLTLTATPIPRTLHMSLLEIKDISIIATPPADRRLIRTYISDDSIIEDAIQRELKRNGQVFFVHNKIPQLPSFVHKIKGLFPEAIVAFAHGQMNERELELVMKKFLEKKIDILVSTTIIESGIDIPNANTMIICDAPNFGLAQLYQLRGRVGRSSRQAYCYFIVPKSKRLSLDAEKRLEALRSLDDLGLGFQLAVRDLEIRGAGNLLGKEQSGNVISVGFELYSQILKEAVANLKGEELELEELIQPEVRFLGSSYIPEDFISDISERLILYQRLSVAKTDDDFRDLKEEITDRFGNPPREFENYFYLMRCRAIFKRKGILRAEQKESEILLFLSPKASFSMDKLEAVLSDEVKLSKSLVLSVKTKKILEPEQILAVCNQIFETIEK